jgi:uncharacterized repeat protein (TIGR01451 family)
MDAEDEGIPGITVQLYAANGTTLLNSKVTDAQGKYDFAALHGATYVVKVIPPAASTPTFDFDGITSANQSTVVLAQNEQKLNVDFGYRTGGTGSVSGSVFHDVGRDGSLHAEDDTLLPDVTTRLYRDLDSDGAIDVGTDALLGTQITDINGGYSFGNLPLNLDYLVKVDQADPVIATGVGGTPYSITTADPHRVQSLGGTYATAHFGFWREVPASIGGVAFQDTNVDGVLNVGETPIANLTITLYADVDGDNNPDPNELVNTIRTDTSGEYLFEGLGAGHYLIYCDTESPEVPPGYFIASAELGTTISAGEASLNNDYPFSRLLTKTVNRTSALAGDQIIYTLTPSYPGCEILSGLTITDTLPAGTSFVSAGQGGTHAGGVVTWNIGTTIPAQPGTVVQNLNLFAFRGGDRTDFWRFDDSTKTWSSRANAPGTVNSGGALASNGINIYALRGDDTTSFWRYNVSANNWTTLASTPGSIYNSGGRLVYLAPYFYALRGDGSTSFYRYNVSTNSWSTMASFPGGSISSGGALTSDGTNIYALRGGGSKYFYRYNVSSNNWTRLRDTPDGIKSGGALVFDSSNIYAFRGDDKTNFFRYSRSSNTWTRMASAPGSVYSGGAIAYGGVSLYALRGDSSSNFWRYNTQSNSWSSLPSTPSSVNSGGAIVEYGAPIPSEITAEIIACNTLVTDGGTATVQMSVGSSETTIAGVNAPALVVTPSNGASATLLSGPTPASGTVPAGGSLTFTWTYRVNAGTSPGNVRFSNSSFIAGTTTLPASSSNSVLVTRPLTFTVSVNSNSGLDSVDNIGSIQTNEFRGCYLVANSTSGGLADRLLKVLGNNVTDVGSTGTSYLRALALNLDSTVLYGVDRDPTAGAGADRIVFNVPTGGSSVVNQWASRVVAYSSQWPDDGNSWKASQALGAPDTVGSGDLPTAWSPATTTSNPEYLHLGFTTAVNATSVRVRETNLGSFVTGIELIEPNGTSHTLSIPADNTVVPGDFVVTFPATSYLVDEVIIRTAKSGYEEIDAVELIGTTQGASATMTPIGRAVSTGNPLVGALGSITVADIRGMAFDPETGDLYAIHRREDGNTNNTLLDCLFKIDPETGLHVDDAFGVGVDYLVIPTNTLPTALYDIDDITFDPGSGQMFAIASDSTTGVGDSDRLIKIDPATGAVTDIGRFMLGTTTTAISNVQGMAFDASGALRVTTGSSGSSTTNNRLWTVNAANARCTAQVTMTSTFPAYTDYEAMACPVSAVIIPPTPSNSVQTSLSGSIGDLVFADNNGNGVRDATEPGVAGVKIVVSNGSITKTATSDGNGAYRVSGLNANGGTPWNVEVDLNTLPRDWVMTTTPVLQRTLATNSTQINDADFGVKKPAPPASAAEIRGIVWTDRDEDGVIEDEEQRLEGIAVNLYLDRNNNGTLEGSDLLVRCVDTDENGLYIMPRLAPGAYLVDVLEYTLPPGMDFVSGGSAIRPVTVAALQISTGHNYGYNHTASIGDLVYYDTDNDRVKDAGEAGIPNVRVSVYTDKNFNGRVDADETEAGIAFTNASGIYTVGNLPAGRYVARVDEQHVPAPAGSPNAGQYNTMLPTNGEEIAVTLAAAQVVTSADFGFAELSLLAGFVFYDVDFSGIRDSIDTGIPNISVVINGTTLGGAPFSFSASTNAEGEYEFLVPAGTYRIAFNSSDPDFPSGMTQTTTAIFHDVTVQGGWELDRLDFGRAYAGALGGVVFADTNGSGTRDSGEGGVPGAVVELFDSQGKRMKRATEYGE